MKNVIKVLVLVLPLAAILPSCGKDKKTDPDPVTEPVVVTPTPVGATGKMNVRFTNMVGGTDSLVLGKNYLNPNGETYSVNKFNYFISNIVLIKNDNSVITIANRYQIIKQSDDTSRTIKLTGIPVGSYKSIKLMLGVDSARNRSGAQTGGLDVGYAVDMYWGWNQGYIFLKLEGSAPTSTLSNNTLAYHIGGYGGVNKAQRVYEIDFIGTEAVVTESKTPTLNVSVNVNEIFKSPTVVSFATSPSILNPNTKDSKMIADNYADMIRFENIKN